MLNGLYNGRKYAIVKFTGKNCNACKKLEPKFANLDIDIDVYDVNHHENKHISRMFNVRALPTAVFFEDGTPSFRMCGLGESEDFFQTVTDVVTNGCDIISWDK
jgi:thioredoxin-like negative regulator of GroEL